MNDRGMKKWRPFNSVIPGSELVKSERTVKMPLISEDEIAEFEEAIKDSMYTHSRVIVTFVENGEIKEIDDFVQKIDATRKDIFFKSKKINFRQILRIQRK